MWVEHLWEQPPSVVRRAQLDLNLHAKIASTPPPLQDSSDAREAVERCRDWHKSGMKKIADHRRPSPGLIDRWKKKDTLSAIACMHRAAAHFRNLATCSFFAGVFPRSANLQWQWDCYSQSRAIPWCVLPRLCTGFVTKSGRINRLSSNRRFYCCKLALFLYIEGCRAASS